MFSLIQKSLASEWRGGNPDGVEETHDTGSPGQFLAAVQIAYCLLKLLVAALQCLQRGVLLAVIEGVVSFVEFFLVEWADVSECI